MGAGASKAEPQHRSLNCRTATVVEFVNDTEWLVQTLWLGYDGTERLYYTLRPGQRVRQPTFSAHPWVFRSPDAPSTQLVVQHQVVFYPPPQTMPGEPPFEARITVAIGVPWCPAAHAAFPPAFRAEAAALLRCHRRLAAGRAAAGRGSPGVAPGCSWLRRLGRTLSGQLAHVAAEAGHPYAAAPTSSAAMQQPCCLGDLPKDVVMEVLAAAAPFMPRLVKPLLPHAVASEELTVEELQLFRLGSSASAVSEAAEAGEVDAAGAGPAQ